MRPTRLGLLTVPLVAALGCGGGSRTASTQQAAGVEFTEVTYAGLDAAVKEHKGKVVLIDVWSIT